MEIGSVHATDAGAGMRFNLDPWADLMPDGWAQTLLVQAACNPAIHAA
jgi:hypothetical protein